MGQVWLELENMIDCAVVFLRPVTTFWMDLCGFMIANRFLELTCYGTINKWSVVLQGRTISSSHHLDGSTVDVTDMLPFSKDMPSINDEQQ